MLWQPHSRQWVGKPVSPHPLFWKAFVDYQADLLIGTQWALSVNYLQICDTHRTSVLKWQLRLAWRDSGVLPRLWNLTSDSWPACCSLDGPFSSVPRCTHSDRPCPECADWLVELLITFPTFLKLVLGIFWKLFFLLSALCLSSDSRARWVLGLNSAFNCVTLGRWLSLSVHWVCFFMCQNGSNNYICPVALVRPRAGKQTKGPLWEQEIQVLTPLIHKACYPPEISFSLSTVNEMWRPLQRLFPYLIKRKRERNNTLLDTGGCQDVSKDDLAAYLYLKRDLLKLWGRENAVFMTNKNHPDMSDHSDSG